MEQLSNLHQQNQMSIYQLMKWWENKSAPEHIKSGHFDVELYIRVCKAKENFEFNIDTDNKV